MESVIERNMRIGADYKRSMFMVKQKQPYEFKKNYAAIRAREFVGMCDEHGKNYHVSVGGLDSITLFLFLHCKLKAIFISFKTIFFRNFFC